jgi:hypothetical protein
MADLSSEQLLGLAGRVAIALWNTSERRDQSFARNGNRGLIDHDHA